MIGKNVQPVVDYSLSITDRISIILALFAPFAENPIERRKQITNESSKLKKKTDDNDALCFILTASERRASELCAESGANDS